MKLRLYVASLAFIVPLLAQQSSERTSTWTIDTSGQRVEGPAYVSSDSPTGGQRMELTRTINGRTVPVQSAEDRVLRKDSQGKSVERIVRKYDQNGNPIPAAKVLTEETKNPDGSTTIQSTTYDVDLSGNLRLSERSITQIRKSGTTTETTTNVERAGLNGSQLLPVLRSTSVERTTPGGSKTESTLYKRDVSGNFAPAAQDIKQVSKSGAQETVDDAHYELDATGKLVLASRAIDHVKTNPDGSQVTDTDVYNKFSVGRTQDATATGDPKLQLQVHRERVPGPGGVVVETTSMRSRLPNDQSQFGTFQKMSQITTTATDASGRQVSNVSTVVSTRDTNGQIVVDHGETDHTVSTKKK